MNKKLSLSFAFLLLLSTAFAQGYTDDLAKINGFLKTLDNGFYGRLEIKNGILYNYYSNGRYAQMNMSDIAQAWVRDPQRKVVIVCKSGVMCVKTGEGNSFDEMPFSQQTDFDASGFAAKLNTLIAHYNNKSAPVDRESKHRQQVVSKADFPVGSKVKLIKDESPYNAFQGALEEQYGTFTEGTVETVDLVPLGDGWYSGYVRMNSAYSKKFVKAKFELVK